ncbi:MAG: AAA family ATPase [Bryobacteraceae bacterium]
MVASESWISYQRGGEESHLYSTVRKAILQCVEGGQEFYFDAARGEVVVEIGSQGILPFNSLSDGQRTLLAMVWDIAQKAAMLNPSLEQSVLEKTPGIVLIDELDLHLHPVWQRRVIEDLRTVFPRIQFFATTHSPFLIQSLRSGEELVMLDGSPTAELANKSLADIAMGIMGVPVQVSQRYRDTATEYLQTLEQSQRAPEAKLADFKQRLADSIAPFADNPAFQAFLEMQRAAKLGE